MEKIWLKNYPEGVPEEINPEQFSSIAEMFATTVKNYPNSPAVSNMGTTYTYAELDKKTDHFAAFLQKKLDLQKGDRLALMMPNAIQYFVAVFAAFKAGLVIVNVNPLYTKRELTNQLKDSGAKAILVMENFAHTVADMMVDYPISHIIITRMGDEFPWPKSMLVNFIVNYMKRLVPSYRLKGALFYREAMRLGKQLTLKPVSLKCDDLAFLQYTGGTTGVPKAAMLTHRNMVANAEQAYHWVKPYVDDGRETVITALPLYHIFSLLANCLVFTRAGSLNVLVTNPRDMKNFAKELKRQPFSAITGVNTLFNAMVHNPLFNDVDFSKLKVALGGGMAVHHSVSDRWKTLTGIPICEAYGLTETSPAVTINPMRIKDYTGSIGLPISSTNVKVIDAEGKELPTHEKGELCIQGPQVMEGYWNRPEETALALSKDGWLKTGDIATIDDNGFVYIVDRKKDMVDVSGFNVYPNEVEEIITQHPGILEAAVIGVPNELTGEALKAFIVKKDPNVTEADVKAFCRQYLTAYKVPKIYEFRQELPKSNVGKILRIILREEEEKKRNSARMS